MPERTVRFDFTGLCSFVSEDWLRGSTGNVGQVDVLLVDAQAGSLGSSLCEHDPFLVFPIRVPGAAYLQKTVLHSRQPNPLQTISSLTDPRSTIGLLPLKGRSIRFSLTHDGDNTPRPMAGGVEKDCSFDMILNVDALVVESGASNVQISEKWLTEHLVEGVVASRLRLDGGTLGFDGASVSRQFRSIGSTELPTAGQIKDFAQSVFWTVPVSGAVDDLVVHVFQNGLLELELFFATGSIHIAAPRFAVSNLCGPEPATVGTDLGLDIAAFFDLCAEVLPPGQRLVAVETGGGVVNGTDTCPPAGQTKPRTSGGGGT